MQFQLININILQRVVCSSAISSMGTGLAAIGHIFQKENTTIGDGSFLMNIQDLQSI